jgi:asparagine N-glycosylation enzyme membrane subunit Stt3
MTEESFKEKKEKFLKNFEFVKNKKFQLAITIILFLVILYTSFSLRLANLDSLKDVTTGKYIPSDPDACYELRVAQTLLDRGNLNGIDEMRNPGLNLGFTQELLPKVLVLSYKILNPINPSKFTLDYIDVMYPNIAFAFSMIIFFFLVFYLTKSKFAAIMSSVILAYSPSYLSRLMTGVSSHEALGMPFFFLAILIFVYSLNNFYKNKKMLLTCGILTGISTALSVLSWSGASNFFIMMIPFALLIYYFFSAKEENKEKEIKHKKDFILFNLLWIFVSIIIMPLFSNSFNTMYGKFTTNYGIVIPFFILFIISDLFLEKFKEKIKILDLKKENKRIFCSLILTFILGIIFLFLVNRNPFDLIYGVYHQMLYPMGQGRIGLTVAYYSQPYLIDIIKQYGNLIFWSFFLGLILLGFEISKGVHLKKDKLIFNLIWIASLFGLTFTRYSSSSLFNGTNFLSQVLYFLSFIALIGIFLFFYLNKKMSIKREEIILLSLTIVMLLSLRSAVRVLFLVYTFVSLMIGYALINLERLRKKTKEEISKTFLFFLFWGLLISLIIFVYGNPLTNSPGTYQISSYSAKYTGPIADNSWQNAMDWVRNNTDYNDTFIHWWDYGYQIQVLANRTTVLDGGNANSFWDHLMGRYGLTETNPNASFSFMKTHNVSYLLIDPTDLGKYPAYSKIGSNDNWDRFAYISSFSLDESQTQEKANSKILIYTGTNGVDQDLEISQNGSEFLIPGPEYDEIGNPNYKAYIIGILEETVKNGNKTSFLQPNAIIYYNNKQIKVPMRYLYVNGEIFDYKNGINATFFIYPSISSSSMNLIGAGLYLSPKVSKSLFARLYLMNDPFNEYPTIKLKVSEDSQIVGLIKEMGNKMGDFVSYNGNFEGPLKIWEINYPEYIKENPEFMNPDGKYAEFDNLNFTKY